MFVSPRLTDTRIMVHLRKRIPEDSPCNLIDHHFQQNDNILPAPAQTHLTYHHVKHTQTHIHIDHHLRSSWCEWKWWSSTVDKKTLVLNSSLFWSIARTLGPCQGCADWARAWHPASLTLLALKHLNTAKHLRVKGRLFPPQWSALYKKPYIQNPS